MSNASGTKISTVFVDHGKRQSVIISADGKWVTETGKDHSAKTVLMGPPVTVGTREVVLQIDHGLKYSEYAGFVVDANHNHIPNAVLGDGKRDSRLGIEMPLSWGMTCNSNAHEFTSMTPLDATGWEFNPSQPNAADTCKFWRRPAGESGVPDASIKLIANVSAGCLTMCMGEVSLQKPISPGTPVRFAVSLRCRSTFKIISTTSSPTIVAPSAEVITFPTTFKVGFQGHMYHLPLDVVSNYDIFVANVSRVLGTDIDIQHAKFSYLDAANDWCILNAETFPHANIKSYAAASNKFYIAVIAVEAPKSEENEAESLTSSFQMIFARDIPVEGSGSASQVAYLQGIRPEDSASQLLLQSEVESWTMQPKVDTVGNKAEDNLSITSCASINSLISANGSPHCFVADVLFPMASGAFYLQASELKKGSHVKAADGQNCLEVATVKQEQTSKLIELHAEDSAPFVTTPSHRIMVPTCGTKPLAVKAEDVKKGDFVLCTNNIAKKVTNVISLEKETIVYAISFKPDEPVTAFMPPSSMILTKGMSFKPTRRAGMNKRAGQHRMPEDIQDETKDNGSDWFKTEGEYSD